LVAIDLADVLSDLEELYYDVKELLKIKEIPLTFPLLSINIFDFLLNKIQRRRMTLRWQKQRYLCAALIIFEPTARAL